MNSLETKVLELIGEDPDSPDVFVDTDEGIKPIRESINDAVQEIAMLVGGYQQDYFLPLRQEQMFYRFAPSEGYIGWVSDAWSVNRQYRLEQTDVIRLSSYDPRWLTTNSEPRSYFQLGADVIGVWPKPSTDTNTLRLTLTLIPSPYTTDTERVKVKEDFKYAVVNYAACEFWASRGDARQAEDYAQLYLDALGLNQTFSNAPEHFGRLETRKEPWPKETD